MTPLPPLTWATSPSRPYDPAAFRAARNRKAGKPIGGLWTAPATPSGNAWSDVAPTLFGDTDRWSVQQPVTPDPSARVAVIDSFGDLSQLLGRFGLSPDEYEPLWLDFERAAEQYDAIHLTPPGLFDCYENDAHAVWGWDCPTVLWLNQAFTVAARP
jgi:hypothetical protein